MCLYYGCLHTSLKVSLFLIACNLSANHVLTLHLCFHGFPMLSGSHLAFSYWSACSTACAGMVHNKLQKDEMEK